MLFGFCFGGARDAHPTGSEESVDPGRWIDVPELLWPQPTVAPIVASDRS